VRAPHVFDARAARQTQHLEVIALLDEGVALEHARPHGRDLAAALDVVRAHARAVGATRVGVGVRIEGAPFIASKPDFDKVAMKAYKVGALSYITHEAMQDMFLDMESWIREDFGTAFADLEEEHFLLGAGAPTAPSGLLASADLGVAAASETAITSDELLDLLYAVNQKYRARGSWLMNDTTILKLRKLKGNDGQYLWQPSLLDGQPDRLLSRPLYTSDTMPEAAASKAAVLFGDFKRYRILDRKGLYFQRLNEIAATSGQVGFLAYRRYDAALLNSDAIKTLTMKAT
jgi:HK97 family phage major capsid protein